MSELDPASRRLMMGQRVWWPLYWVMFGLGRSQHNQPWDACASLTLAGLLFVGSWYGKGALKDLVTRRTKYMLVAVGLAAASAILWGPRTEQRLLGYAALCAPVVAAIVRGALRPAPILSE
jgi:hypothetical protein